MQGCKGIQSTNAKHMSVQQMTTFQTLPNFLGTFKAIISEAVSFHEHNLILIIFVHVTLSSSFASLTVALKFRWLNIDKVPSSGTDHILIHQIQQCLGFLHLINFHQFACMHRSNTFPFDRGKFITAENKFPKLPILLFQKGCLFQMLCPLSVLCWYFGCCRVSEIAWDACLQATELYPWQTICLPVEVFPLRYLGTKYYLVSMSVILILAGG